MMTKHGTPRGFSRKRLVGAALCALVLGAPQLPASVGLFIPVAHAQSESGQGGTAAHGTNSTHAPGTSGSYMGQGGQAVGRGHNGQGGSTGEESDEEGASTDRQGPRYGGSETSRKPNSETQGGRPAWAKEGIPSVELGRLSVARAPATVLDHAFEEVIKNWDGAPATEETAAIPAMSTTIITLTSAVDLTINNQEVTWPAGTEITVAQLYSMTAANFAAIVATNYDAVTRIDSPLENLSLLKNLLLTDSTALTGVTPASIEDLAGIFLGSASDKTIDISTDTVTAINTILGLPDLTAAETATIAADAEAVRDAIETGHG